MTADNGNTMHYLELLKECKLEVETSELKASHRTLLLEQIHQNIDFICRTQCDINQQNLDEMRELHRMMKSLCAGTRSNF